MPLKVFSDIDGELALRGEVAPGQNPGFMRDCSTGSDRLVLFMCHPDDQSSIIAEADPSSLNPIAIGQFRIDTGARVLATLSDGERFEINIRRTPQEDASKVVFEHEKRTVSPIEVIISMFRYFKTDTLSFQSILMCATAQVWGKTTPPPSELIKAMDANVRAILEQMVQDEQLEKVNRGDGQTHYKLLAGK